MLLKKHKFVVLLLFIGYHVRRLYSINNLVFTCSCLSSIPGCKQPQRQIKLIRPSNRNQTKTVSKFIVLCYVVTSHNVALNRVFL